MTGLEIDFETRSDVNLKIHGVYRYMESPLTAPLMASYQIDGGALRRWLPGEPCPADIRAHVEAGGLVTAHNNAFERLLWQMILTPRYGWPALRLEQCRCTAATAAAMALPRDLKTLGAALGLTDQKDKEGDALIRFFSVPRRPRGTEPPGVYFNEPADAPERFERFRAYCDQDVRTEAAADARMFPLSASEQDLWLIDQRINDRGLRIDVESAYAALRLVDKAKAGFDREMTLATGGAVARCSEVEKLSAWAVANGAPVASLAKADVDDMLDCDDLPERVRTAFEIRLEAAKTSTRKLKSALDRVSPDGRLRGAFLFCAAGTRRWSSTGMQVHNLPRPRKVFADAKLETKALFETIRTGDPDALRAKYGPLIGRPMHLVSDAMRGFIWAAPGYDLLSADYSGIEGAVAAWLAGEDWKVRALFDLIADPKLPDMYLRAAAGIFGVDVATISKKDERRQVGKVAELALQYQGGPAAFRSMARNYAMKLAPLYPLVWGSADEARREQAVKRYDNALARKEGVTTLLTREEFLAAEIVKLGWRATHPAIVEQWAANEDGAREAVRNPGKIVSTGKCSYLVSHGYLVRRLPSSGCLFYGAPRLKAQVWVLRKQPDGTWPDVSETMGKDEAEAAQRRGEVRIEREAKSAVTALGVNSVTKKWERFGLYGGLAFENDVQAVARDLLANGIVRAEAAGYPVVGHVHDEIITEVPRGFGDVRAFERLICELPPWAEGLPLTASGWRGKRYRKD